MPESPATRIRTVVMQRIKALRFMAWIVVNRRRRASPARKRLRICLRLARPVTPFGYDKHAAGCDCENTVIRPETHPGGQSEWIHPCGSFRETGTPADFRVEAQDGDGEKASGRSEERRV